MMNYECDFSQSEREKYFERMIIAHIESNVKGCKNLRIMLFSLYTITHSLSTSISIGSYPLISWFTVIGFYQLNTNWAIAGFHCHAIENNTSNS